MQLAAVPEPTTLSRSEPSPGGAVGGWAVVAEDVGVVVALDPTVLDPGVVVLAPALDPVVDEEPDGSDPVVVEPSADGSTTRADDGTADPWGAVVGAVVGMGQVVELVPASMVASEPAAVSSGELQAEASSNTATAPTSARRRNGAGANTTDGTRDSAGLDR